jgi:hypothetical protein
MIYDIGNLLCTWEKCLIDLNDSINRLIVHLENGYPDRALIRAKETKAAIDRMTSYIQKMKCHCVGEVHNNVERKI